MPQPMHLLFVCTGNTCRSPLAEVIARRLAEDRGMSALRVGSAGTSAWEGASASDGALLVAMEHGLDLSAHRARTLTPALVAASDLILTMGPQHLERVLSMGGAGRTHLLTGYASGGAVARPVGDPFGGDLAVYRATFAELLDEVTRTLDRLAPTSRRGSD